MIGGAVLSAYGSYKSAQAARADAHARKVASQFEAEQFRVEAGQVVAAAQRTALEEGRKSKLLESRALALAAASGGGASDPTVTKLISSLAAEGAYRSEVAMYQGEERARKLRMGVAAKEFEGEQALQAGEAKADAYQIHALSSLIGGASMFGRYGGGGPAGDSALVRNA